MQLQNQAEAQVHQCLSTAVKDFSLMFLTEILTVSYLLRAPADEEKEEENMIVPMGETQPLTYSRCALFSLFLEFMCTSALWMALFQRRSLRGQRSADMTLDIESLLSSNLMRNTQGAQGVESVNTDSASSHTENHKKTHNTHAGLEMLHWSAMNNTISH